jgi:glycosyltransferase involved in cell wall biosynthesis
LDVWPRRHKRLKKLLYYLVAERKNISQAAGIRVSSKMEADGSSRFASKGQELRIIPNGLDFGSWNRDVDAGKQWRAEAGIPADCFLYLSVGRLHKIKGLELVVKALAPLRGQNWHLAFVGDDEDGSGAELGREAKKLGLVDQVSFHPTLPGSKLQAVYSAGDLFVLPSHHENFGNVVLEALACECPVLISDQVGISGDLLGIRGVQVRKRDLSLWSEALTSALAGRSEVKSNSSDRKELERRFSIHHCARKMMEFHESAIARTRS